MWHKFNCEKTVELKLWQNQKKLKLWQNLGYDKSQFKNKKTSKDSFSKNILTPWQPMRCFLGTVLQISQRFFYWMQLEGMARYADQHL